jgi:hypothetical protein
MASGLFFLIIGLVCLLTIILLFCEFSCRGDAISEFSENELQNTNMDQEQDMTMNNNNSEEDSLVSTAIHLPRLTQARRQSIKVLVRKESIVSTPSSQPAV